MAVPQLSPRELLLKEPLLTLWELPPPTLLDAPWLTDCPALALPPIDAPCDMLMPELCCALDPVLTAVPVVSLLANVVLPPRLCERLVALLPPTLALPVTPVPSSPALTEPPALQLLPLLALAPLLELMPELMPLVELALEVTPWLAPSVWPELTDMPLLWPQLLPRDCDCDCDWDWPELQLLLEPSLTL